MGNASVDGATVDQLPCGHIEEYVYYDSARNRCKEYAYAQPTNRLLLAPHILLLVRVGVEEEMREDRQHSHCSCAAPCIERVVTIFASVGDAQKHIPRSKGFPYVIAEAIQPKECGQQAEAQNDVRHNEAHVIGEIREYADQICCLADHQAHCNCRNYISDQISAKKQLSK